MKDVFIWSKTRCRNCAHALSKENTDADLSQVYYGTGQSSQQRHEAADGSSQACMDPAYWPVGLISSHGGTADLSPPTRLRGRDPGNFPVRKHHRKLFERHIWFLSRMPSVSRCREALHRTAYTRTSPPTITPEATSETSTTILLSRREEVCICIELTGQVMILTLGRSREAAGKPCLRWHVPSPRTGGFRRDVRVDFRRPADLFSGLGPPWR